MNSIVKTNNQPEVTEAELLEYLDTFCATKKLFPEEKRQFLAVAKACGLNPFNKELYIVAYGEGKNRQCSLITGYEVYIRRAERSGLLNGWRTKLSGKGEDMTCTIKIRRKDWEDPFFLTTEFKYAAQRKDGRPTGLWATRPDVMLRKVAISQAFRLCFSTELAGMPYTDSELPLERDVTEAPPTPPTPKPAESGSDDLEWIMERRELLEAMKYAMPHFDEEERQKWKDLVGKIPQSKAGMPELRKLAEEIRERLEILELSDMENFSEFNQIDK